MLVRAVTRVTRAAIPFLASRHQRVLHPMLPLLPSLAMAPSIDVGRGVRVTCQVINLSSALAAAIIQELRRAIATNPLMPTL